MRQRREFLASNSLNNKPVTIALAAKSGHRHATQRKCDLDGIRKAQRRISGDFFRLMYRHRANLEGRSNEYVNPTSIILTNAHPE